MSAIKITLGIKNEAFIVEKIEPVSKENLLLEDNGGSSNDD